MAQSEILSFVAEWFDPQPKTVKQFILKVFVQTEELELCDKNTNKCFLKRSRLPPNLTLEDFSLGAKVNIHSRLMSITDFGDRYTRIKLESTLETFTLLIGPDAYRCTGKIIDHILKHGRYTQF